MNTLTLHLNRAVSALGTAVTTGAKVYKGAIDSTYYVGLGALECVSSAASIVGSVWNGGVTGNAKKIAKSCVGLDHFAKATKEMGKTTIFVNGSSVRRTIPDRLGATMGHVANAVTQAVGSSAALGGAMTYVIGETRNLFGMQYSNNTYFAGAQIAAAGVNIAMKAVASPVLSCAETVASFVGSSLVSVAMDPTNVVTVGAPMAGAGALLYLAAYELENASAATGKVGKVFHRTMALAAAASACLVPGLGYALGISS